MNKTLKKLIDAGDVLKCQHCQELNAWTQSDSNMRAGKRITGGIDAETWEENIYLIHHASKMTYECGNCSTLNPIPLSRHKIIAALNADKDLVTAITSAGHLFTFGLAKELVIAERHNLCLAFYEFDFQPTDKIIGKISL